MATGSLIARVRDASRRTRWLQGRRRTALVISAAVALALGVGALISRATEQAELLGALRDASWGWLAVCLPAQLLAYAGYVMAYRDGARVDGGPVLSWRRSAELVVAGVGAMVAASGAGGLAVHFWALSRAGAPTHEAVRRVLGLNTLNWAVLGLAAALGSAVLILQDADAPLGATLAWALGVPACVVAAAWVSSPRRHDRLSRTEGRGRLGQALADAIGGLGYVRHLVARPLRYRSGVAGFPLFWAGHLLCLYAGLRAFGGTVGWAALVVGFATGYAASALPLPAGGAGGVDAAMTFALSMVGVPLGTALLGVFAYRLFTFWLPLVPALFLLPRVAHLHDELADTRREGPEPAPAAP